jgi:hypothetical protein
MSSFTTASRYRSLPVFTIVHLSSARGAAGQNRGNEKSLRPPIFCGKLNSAGIRTRRAARIVLRFPPYQVESLPCLRVRFSIVNPASSA